jgi:hypothetical protein
MPNLLGRIVPNQPDRCNVRADLVNFVLPMQPIRM